MLNYIKNTIKSLFTKKISGRDLLFIGVIIFLLFREGCNLPSPNTYVKTPELVKVELVNAKDGTTQAVIKQTILSKREMKEDTKGIKKNLKVDEVDEVTKTTNHLNFTSPELPTTLDTLDNTIVDNYSDKDISLKHSYNLSTKKGKFEIHLVPDTMTIVDTKTNHWFKPNEHNIEINHTNSLIKTELASSYTYKEAKVWLVVGPSIGTSISYNNNQWAVKPIIGITATVPLISIKRRK